MTEPKIIVELVGGERGGCEIEVAAGTVDIPVIDPDSNGHRLWIYRLIDPEVPSAPGERRKARYRGNHEAEPHQIGRLGYELPPCLDAEPVVEMHLTTAPPGEGFLNLRFPKEYTEEIRAALDEQGVEHSEAMEFSEGVELAIETVRALGPEGFAAIAATISVAIIRLTNRHHDKKFLVKGAGFEVSSENASAKETTRLVEGVARMQGAQEARWRRMQETTERGTPHAEDEGGRA